MKKNLITAAAIVLITTTFFACKKKTTDVVPTVDDAKALTEFFERNVVPSQNFSIDNTVGGSAITAKGSKITFPPNAFLRNGVAVTGNVNIEFKELVDKVDFVLSNKGTLSNDLPLESGGTWMLKPWQGTELLKINPAALVQINIRRDSAVQGNMLLFNANPAGNANGGAINWGQERRQITPLSTPFNNYFSTLDSVGWGNADRFMTNPQYAVNTKVVSSNGTALTSFSAMFVYKGKKIVWPMQGRSAGAVTDSHVAKNQIGHVVVFGFVNSVFTTGVLLDQTVTTDNQTFTVTLGTNTEAAFKTQLSSVLL